MHYHKKIKSLIFPLMILCIYTSPSTGTAAWHTEIVEDNYQINGRHNYLALDSNNNPHISYDIYDHPIGRLMYAHHDGALWHKVLVDPPTQAANISLNLNLGISPRIIYYTGNSLKYAWCDSVCDTTDDWGIESINNTETGTYPSSTLDSSGMPHVCYWNVNDSDLVYTYHDGIDWTPSEVIDSDGVVGYFSSLALDSSGKAHVSYYDLTNGNLKYATNDSGAWVTDAVDSIGDVGRYTSIGLDPEGKAHISYYDYTNRSLKYATNASGTWSTELVDSMGTHEEYNKDYTSLDLDPEGKVHISYYDQTNGDLKYVTNTSGIWEIEIVDTSLKGDTSLALDSYNRPHISYYDFTNADLKYAKKCFAMDADCDDTLDTVDNCPNDYNPSQEDTSPPGGNGIGDACDCEGNFNCDTNLDARDVTLFLTDFGRSIFFNPCSNEVPCNGDFNCDVNVDAADVSKFLEDFGRSIFNNPCPACEVGNWCIYAP